VRQRLAATVLLVLGSALAVAGKSIEARVGELHAALQAPPPQ
jgi:hypothetical protein